MDFARRTKKKARKRAEKRAYYSDRVVTVNPLDTPLSGKLSFSVAHSGKLAALGSDQGLFLFDLELQSSQQQEARSVVKTFYSEQPVNAASWSPHQSTQELLASLCGLEVSLWNTDHSSHPLLHRFQAHKFPVTDVSWSPLQPGMFSTCSELDSHFYFWDQRKLGRPALDFSPPGNVGCDRVIWHTRAEHMVATVHKGVARLWDTRKGILASINAHRSPIDSLQWSPSYDHFVTCSRQDYKLKFWSSLTHDCLYNLQTKQPVHSVLYTPFGNGLVTASDNSLRLWKVGVDLGRDLVISDQEEVLPVHTFSDSLESVLHVDWRHSPSGLPQLASLGSDHAIHLWNITPQLQQAVPKGVVQQKISNEEVAEEGMYLDQEVKAIGDSIPGIRFTKVNLLQRVLDVEFIPFPRSVIYKLRIDIPEVYPYNIVPLFTFKESHLDPAIEARIIADMAQVGSLEVERAHSCLSQCLQHLSQNFLSYLNGQQPEERQSESGVPGDLPDVAATGDEDNEGEDSDKEAAPEPVRLADETIICPRLCGASWSMQGHLIYFNNFPTETQRLLEAAQSQQKKDEAGVEVRSRKRSSKLHSPETSDHSEAEENDQYNTPIEDFMESSRVFALPRTYLDLRKRLLEGGPSDTTSEDEGVEHHPGTPVKRPVLGRSDSKDSNDSILAMDANSLMASISKDTQRQTDPQLGSSAALPLTEGGEEEDAEGDETEEDSDVQEEETENVDHVPKEDRFFKAFAARGGNPFATNEDNSSTAAAAAPKQQFVKQQEEVARMRAGRRAQSTTIVVADVARVLPVSAQLARAYQLMEGETSRTCSRNSDIAKSFGREDLAHSWALASFITKPRDMLTLAVWDEHPLGGALARRLLKSYASDIQMFALLACVFESFRHSLAQTKPSISHFLEESQLSTLDTQQQQHQTPLHAPQHSPEPVPKLRSSPLHMLGTDPMIRTRSEPVMHQHPHPHDKHPKDGLSGFLRKMSHGVSDALQLPRPVRESSDPEKQAARQWHSRNSSFSNERPDSLNAVYEHDEPPEFPSHILLPVSVCEPIALEKHADSLVPLLPGEDLLKIEYADYLSHIGAHQQRAELLKFSVSSRWELFRKSCYDPLNFSVAFSPNCCLKCLRSHGRPHAGPHGALVLQCGVCRISVRGLSSVCLLCQHGGHPNHIKSWFEQEESCPMGCGCSCRQNASLIRLGSG